MARIDGLIASFRACPRTYPFEDFETILRHLGYEAVKTGRSGGSRRRYHHPQTGRIVMLHEPHDGEMSGEMIRRLVDDLFGGAPS